MPKPIDNLQAIHPGEFLRDDLEALGVSARKFADHIHVPHNAITEIMNGKRAITAQMAHRLEPGRLKRARSTGSIFKPSMS